MSTHTTRFEVDAHDAISWVSDDWILFARENDAAELTRERVVGRPLWDFIDSAEVRVLYRGLAHRVRARGRALEIPFRCDSPARARFMRMRISAAGGGGLGYECVTEREVARVAAIVLAREETRGERMLTMCSLCKDVRDALGHWVELETAIAVSDLLSSRPLPSLSHGICSRCESLLQASAGDRADGPLGS